MEESRAIFRARVADVGDEVMAGRGAVDPFGEPSKPVTSLNLVTLRPFYVAYEASINALIGMHWYGHLHRNDRPWLKRQQVSNEKSGHMTASLL